MSNSIYILLLLISVAFGVSSSSSNGDERVKVYIQQGAIEAPKVDLEKGHYYYAFKNIPYAQPPVRALRFKDPIPAGPWTGVKNGSEPTKACPQYEVFKLLAGEFVITGDEDCLHLDVYTPKPFVASEKPLPVMVWIHGGGLSVGEIEGSVPTPLLKNDVVVVNIQYRLGTIGFLSTDDSVIPGNRGLKDQVMALRWVQNNIREFGGDPSQVTIFGESAGGLSVHLHMLSPMSKGLFHRVIAQSGTALLPGFLRTDHRERAAMVGKNFECAGVDPNNLNSQLLLDCLKDVTVEQLLAAPNAFIKFSTSPQVMVPSIDGDFLLDHPATLLRKGQYNIVDFMAGITKDEGGLFITFVLSDPNSARALGQNFSESAPYLMHFETNEQGIYNAKRIFFHYIGGFNVTEDNIDLACKTLGQLNFDIPLDVSAKMHARDTAFGKNIFLYEFHHRGAVSLFGNPNVSYGQDWVNHADELQYLFETPYYPKLSRNSDIIVGDILPKLWTNFATTGEPTPNMNLGFKWSPTTCPENLKYLMINPSPYMRGNVREKDLDFWTNLSTKTNHLLYPEKFQ